jgi:hypothetical protein
LIPENEGWDQYLATLPTGKLYYNEDYLHKAFSAGWVGGQDEVMGLVKDTRELIRDFEAAQDDSVLRDQIVAQQQTIEIWKNHYDAARVKVNQIQRELAKLKADTKSQNRTSSLAGIQAKTIKRRPR